MNFKRLALAMGANVVAIAILLWLLSNLSMSATAESVPNKAEGPVPLRLSDAIALRSVPITDAKMLTTAGSDSAASILQSLNSGQHFLPSYGNDRDRFGFLIVNDALTGYNVAELHAGWYYDREATKDPSHPDNLVYAQLVSFTAGPDSHDPSQVTASPGRDVIAQIAAAHPGSLWIMGNKPDSLYQGNSLFPEVYAHVYHEYYHYIRGLDPTAVIANGGVVQPTTCRLEYLDIVWGTYYQAYSETLPVDVWNIHAHILREVYGSWGTSTPPGVDPSCGIDYAIRDADDVDIFRENLIAFRQWMKDKGEQDRPLIISEYGVLWPSWLNDEDGRGWPAARVSHYMTQTFDLFLYEAFPDVGYPKDDYRLVQAWAWYSLSDDTQYNGYLFSSTTKQISEMGQIYADYTGTLPDPRYTDLSVGLDAGYAGSSTSTISLSATVGNLGKLPASGVLARAEVVSIEDGSVIFSRTEESDIPARFDGVVAWSPLTVTLPVSGLYELSFVADPNHEIPEPREWNNGITKIVGPHPEPHRITLYNLWKGSSGVSSRYIITNTGSEAATILHAYYDNWGALVASEISEIPGGESRLYALAPVTGLPDGYKGYAVVSADQPIIGTVMKAELNVTKHADPDPVKPGELLTYTIHITNTGQVDLHATITDTLPQYVTLGQPSVWTSQVITAPGGMWTKTIVVTVEMGYMGTLTNVVQVMTEEGVTATYTETSEIEGTPRLVVTKQANPDPVRSGAQLTYTIRITNTGNVNLHATVTDTLPVCIATGRTSGGTLLIPGGVVTWTPTIAASGGIWMETIVVTVEKGYAGQFVNLVEVSTEEGAMGVYSETSTVLFAPLNRSPYTPTNPIPFDGANDVPITQTLSWQGGDPDDGDRVTYMIALGTTDPLPFVTTTTLTSHMPSLAPNTAYYWVVTATDSISTVVGPTWSFTTVIPAKPFASHITKTVIPTGQVNYGGELTYTLVVSAVPGTQLSLYDPLTTTTFLRFVEPVAGITHTNRTITGTLTVTPSNQVTVSFVVEVGVPGTAGWTVRVTNRVCVYPLDGTVAGCVWSNEVINPAFRPYEIFLPLVLRSA